MIKKGDRFIDPIYGIIREVTHTHAGYYFIMVVYSSDDKIPYYSSEWTKEMIESRLNKIVDVDNEGLK